MHSDIRTCSSSCDATIVALFGSKIELRQTMLPCAATPRCENISKAEEALPHYLFSRIYIHLHSISWRNILKTFQKAILLFCGLNFLLLPFWRSYTLLSPASALLCALELLSSTEPRCLSSGTTKRLILSLASISEPRK